VLLANDVLIRAKECNHHNTGADFALNSHQTIVLTTNISKYISKLQTWHMICSYKGQIDYLTIRRSSIMKTRIITTAAVVGLLAALAAGEALAAGFGGGRGQGASASAGATTATRPVGSQRRDGTFLTTGTTANGSTTRNGNGNGLQSGTCLTPPTTPAPAPAQ
jgi:hypothetical protein